MKHPYFESHEYHDKSVRLKLDDVIDQIAFNNDGVIPVVTQDAKTQQVLMLAWMNRHTLALTLDTGLMTYWSRSRQAIWRKGETSGHSQRVISMSLDCDGDALLCQVEQTGAACHTGRKHCFYLSIDRNHRTVCVLPR